MSEHDKEQFDAVALQVFDDIIQAYTACAVNDVAAGECQGLDPFDDIAKKYDGKAELNEIIVMATATGFDLARMLLSLSPRPTVMDPDGSMMIASLLVPDGLNVEMMTEYLQGGVNIHDENELIDYIVRGGPETATKFIHFIVHCLCSAEVDLTKLSETMGAISSDD